MPSRLRAAFLLVQRTGSRPANHSFGSAARTRASGKPSSRRTILVPSTMRHAFVERDTPGQPLAAEAAIGRDDELLLRDIFQRLADQRRDVVGRFDHRVAMVDDADADLLVGPDVLEQMQVLP